MIRLSHRVRVYLWCADGMPWKYLRAATVPAWMAGRGTMVGRGTDGRLTGEVIWMVKEEYEYATRRDVIGSQPVP